MRKILLKVANAACCAVITIEIILLTILAVSEEKNQCLIYVRFQHNKLYLPWKFKFVSVNKTVSSPMFRIKELFCFFAEKYMRNYTLIIKRILFFKHVKLEENSTVACLVYFFNIIARVFVSSPGLKDQVSFSRYLASTICCRPSSLTFKIEYGGKM